MTDLQHAGAADRVSELPHPGAALSLSLPCCAGDLPTRVLALDGSLVSVTAPIHVCGKTELAQAFMAVWDTKVGVSRANGVVESSRPRPPTWNLRVNGPIEHLEIEERFPDDSPGMLDIGVSRLPARIVDRSLHGVACVVPALTQLRPGQRVRVIVGKHDRAGTIARVRALNNQLRVGIRLDDL